MTDTQKPHIANSRRDFLKKLSFITACVIIENPLELVLKPESTIKTCFLKITHELEKDSKGLAIFIKNNGLKLSNNDPKWENKTTIQIGFYKDDFIRNMKTLKMVYVS